MMSSVDLNSLARHDEALFNSGMEQQKSPHETWVKAVQDEIEQISEKLERLDSQGMIDHRLRSRLNELQSQIEGIKKLLPRNDAMTQF